MNDAIEGTEAVYTCSSLAPARDKRVVYGMCGSVQQQYGVNWGLTAKLN